ncbi:MAG: hypothetical protein ACD_4C00491G0003 [uncultured bacterium (gcode 4)]|uniref:Uncharacterized protein n=1 Tax=uncultured bacterium (gcode 4) TaxID=1234023 RepID=K2F463_9BACT|nr:MAG: hypothetical protein ACD_4C00491G0003 [uncultured bacterium (gcode 4)]
MSKSLSIKIYILVLSIIFVTSVTSALLLFFYMDIESNMKVGFTTMGTAFFLSISSFLSLIIFFFKRIYYRWEIYIRNLNSSLRQWVLLSSFVLWNIIFEATWVFSYKTAVLLFVIIFFIELIFQSIWD